VVLPDSEARDDAAENGQAFLAVVSNGAGAGDSDGNSHE
jgi:hypothetical protein